LGRPVAGKTGTTNDETDAWFVGYTADYTAGVWVGYDDQNITLGAGSTGGTLATPIWTAFMKVAQEGLPIRNFAVPQGIEWELIDPRTGFLARPGTAGAVREAFVEGTAPNRYSTVQRAVRYDDLISDEGGF
jgi:penicillin-binding protein 1A